MVADLYDEARGPRNPRSHPRQRDEWEDPMAWIDLLLSAPAQVAANALAAASARTPQSRFAVLPVSTTARPGTIFNETKA